MTTTVSSTQTQREVKINLRAASRRLGIPSIPHFTRRERESEASIKARARAGHRAEFDTCKTLAEFRRRGGGAISMLSRPTNEQRPYMHPEQIKADVANYLDEWEKGVNPLTGGTMSGDADGDEDGD